MGSPATEEKKKTIEMGEVETFLFVVGDPLSLVLIAESKRVTHISSKTL